MPQVLEGNGPAEMIGTQKPAFDGKVSEELPRCKVRPSSCSGMTYLLTSDMCETDYDASKVAKMVSVCSQCTEKYRNRICL